MTEAPLEKAQYRRQVPETRRLHLAARTVVLVVLAVAVVACGGEDDGEPVATEPPVTEASTTTVDAAAGDEGGGACDGLDSVAVADIVGEVADTGTVSGEPTFGRPDGTELTYAVEGCSFEVVVAGDDEPHEFSVSIGTAPDGVDLFEEFRASRQPDDLRPASGVGDEAFLDATSGDQSVQLIVDTGDDVLFVESDPPFGVPVADDDVLIALADLALGR